MSASYFCQQIGPKPADWRFWDTRRTFNCTLSPEHRALKSDSTLPLASTPTSVDFNYGKQNPLICFEDQQMAVGSAHFPGGYAHQQGLLVCPLNDSENPLQLLPCDMICKY